MSKSLIDSGLTPKQEMFCVEYIKDQNATRSAKAVGFSEKTASEQGSRLLTNVKVASRIKELQTEVFEKKKLDTEYVIDNLMNIVGMATKAEPVMIWDADQKCMVESGEYKFDSQGANKALELLGKHLGMFKDKLEVTNKFDLTEFVRERRNRRLNAIDTEVVE